MACSEIQSLVCYRILSGILHPSSLVILLLLPAFSKLLKLHVSTPQVSSNIPSDQVSVFHMHVMTIQISLIGHPDAPLLYIASSLSFRNSSHSTLYFRLSLSFVRKSFKLVTFCGVYSPAQPVLKIRLSLRKALSVDTKFVPVTLHTTHQAHHLDLQYLLPLDCLLISTLLGFSCCELVMPARYFFSF
jgi:hypothetical protein